ncbi:MAG TPA: NTP transferase domain-containing protein [Baekduia sp.]|nr:NTP transferase domain-containing protein [Baekduia sp.]
MPPSPVAPPAADLHVVVLAAGRGSRLGALGAETPKWLLEVGGRPLADRHLAGVAASGAVASTRVVTGHAAEAIERMLASRPGAPATVHVAEFAERNNWWSLLCALRCLPAGGAVAVVNADLCVEPATLTAFLDDTAVGDADGVLAVDLLRDLTDESMKVARKPDGTLDRIGKAGVADAAGEYVGMLMARGEVLAALRATLESFVDRPGAAGEWYEGAVARTAAAGTPWHVWPMPSSAWVEIDDDADLGAAQSLAAAA